MNITAELKSVTRTRKLLNAMLWLIVTGAVFYSLMTSTPLVSAHSPWPWSGWALGILTDAAFILSISADAVLSKHGLSGGRWPTAFRWVTGLASLFLNTWSSVAERDGVGVAIHSIAPAILVCASEVAPIYRRKFRELELLLSREVTEQRVTRAVTPKRLAEDKAGVTESVGNKPELSPTKQGIKDAFLSGLTPTEAARELGVSRPYVSKVYKEIREALALTA